MCYELIDTVNMDALFDIKEGLDTGLLLDISDIGREYGITCPLYLSSFVLERLAIKENDCVQGSIKVVVRELQK